MANEGLKIVGEGIALRASDIDVAYVNGYGFPRHQGGPMYWAERQAGARSTTRCATTMPAQGELWTPAPLLADMARRARCLEAA